MSTEGVRRTALINVFRFALLATSTLVAVLFVECGLMIYQAQLDQKTSAGRPGFDNRSRLEVIDDLESMVQQVDAVVDRQRQLEKTTTRNDGVMNLQVRRCCKHLFETLCMMTRSNKIENALASSTLSRVRFRDPEYAKSTTTPTPTDVRSFKTTSFV